MKFLIKIMIILVAALLLPAVALFRTDNTVEVKWYEDFEQAKKIASQEGKDLLIDFTGSDWCPWCKRLDEEVFSQDEFKNEAPKHFVLVKLDYPNDKSKMPKEIIAQNERLAEEYPIPGFPTVFLMDADGRPYAQTGYQKGGPQKYNEDLANMVQIRVKRDDFLAQRRGKIVVEDGKRRRLPVEDSEKARLTDQALSVMDEEIVDKFYTEEIKQIIELDAENAAGLKAKYELRLRLNEATKVLDDQQYQKAVKMMDALIKDLNLTGPDAQQVLFTKCQGLFYLEDMKALEKGLREAYHAAPETKLAADITKRFERLFPDKDIIKK